MTMHAGNVAVMAASLVIIGYRQAASDSTTMCEKLRCENQSGCRLVINNNRTHAECVCQDGWMGRRCNLVLKPEIVIVTMTTVTLRITVHIDTRVKSQAMNAVKYINKTEIYTEIGTVEHITDLGDTNTFENHGQRTPHSMSHNLTYSLQYWNTNQITLCHVIAIATEREITIRGLKANSKYVFCAKPSYVESLCSPFLVSETRLPRNCVTVSQTAENNAETDDKTETYVWILISSVIALIALLVLIIIIIMSFRKKYFYQLMCAGDIYNKRKRRKLRRRQPNAEHAKLERLLPNSVSTATGIVQIEMDCMTADGELPSVPHAQQIRITPPNTPGKPKHQLTQNTKRGYVSFASINEQTIPLSTVIEDRAEGDEYQPADDNVTQLDGC